MVGVPRKQGGGGNGVSTHGHPSPRDKHEAAALERVLHGHLVTNLAEHEQRVREIERRRVLGVLVQDNVETDFEGCVG
jgi:hypothetical protein